MFPKLARRVRVSEPSSLDTMKLRRVEAFHNVAVSMVAGHGWCCTTTRSYGEEDHTGIVPGHKEWIRMGRMVLAAAVMEKWR